MTDTIYAQIMQIRDSGIVNMCDCIGVQRVAYERDMFELVNYIEEDPVQYFQFILYGKETDLHE